MDYRITEIPKLSNRFLNRFIGTGSCLGNQWKFRSWRMTRHAWIFFLYKFSSRSFWRMSVLYMGTVRSRSRVKNETYTVNKKILIKDPKLKLNLKYFWENWFQNCFFKIIGFQNGTSSMNRFENWNLMKNNLIGYVWQTDRHVFKLNTQH